MLKKTRSMSSAMRIALLERENARLKMLCARFAEWLYFPTGTLEDSPDKSMTLVIKTPSGVIHLPVDRQYSFGIWHQYGDEDDDPSREVHDLRINQLIAGVLVRTLKTYFVTPEDEEVAKNESA